MSSRGERHVRMCYDCFALFALIFFSLPSPIIQYEIQGENEIISKVRKCLDFIAYLYSLGTCLYPIEYPVLTLYMSSQSWYSCGLLFLLCLVDIPVLSNLVYSGSSLPKLAQDHKVSICITFMCMMISCYCTYCLQEGIMNMEVHFLYSHHLL